MEGACQVIKKCGGEGGEQQSLDISGKGTDDGMTGTRKHAALQGLVASQQSKMSLACLRGDSGHAAP